LLVRREICRGRMMAAWLGRSTGKRVAKLRAAADTGLD